MRRRQNGPRPERRTAGTCRPPNPPAARQAHFPDRTLRSFVQPIAAPLGPLVGVRFGATGPAQSTKPSCEHSPTLSPLRTPSLPGPDAEKFVQPIAAPLGPFVGVRFEAAGPGSIYKAKLRIIGPPPSAAPTPPPEGGGHRPHRCFAHQASPDRTPRSSSNRSPHPMDPLLGSASRRPVRAQSTSQVSSPSQGEVPRRGGGGPKDGLPTQHDWPHTNPTLSPDRTPRSLVQPIAVPLGPFVGVRFEAAGPGSIYKAKLRTLPTPRCFAHQASPDRTPRSSSNRSPHPLDPLLGSASRRPVRAQSTSQVSSPSQGEVPRRGGGGPKNGLPTQHDWPHTNPTLSPDRTPRSLIQPIAAPHGPSVGVRFKAAGPGSTYKASPTSSPSKWTAPNTTGRLSNASTRRSTPSHHSCHCIHTTASPKPVAST